MIHVLIRLTVLVLGAMLAVAGTAHAQGGSCTKTCGAYNSWTGDCGDGAFTFVVTVEVTAWMEEDGCAVVSQPLGGTRTVMGCFDINNPLTPQGVTFAGGAHAGCGGSEFTFLQRMRQLVEEPVDDIPQTSRELHNEQLHILEDLVARATEGEPAAGGGA